MPFPPIPRARRQTLQHVVAPPVERGRGLAPDAKPVGPVRLTGSDDVIAKEREMVWAMRAKGDTEGADT